jgi:hypothetical protein
MHEVAAAQVPQPDVLAPREPVGETTFQPSKDTKKIPQYAAHPDLFVTVGAGLNDK